ncbi:MAG: hypothetical protein EBR30_26745 [Cytophagia bacterium]|jgi:hypothetical protein|nr:hypothetical protein [Cytophagia bacterium]NBW38553.1 hypothetical protein [Cytophagia bacterium]
MARSSNNSVLLLIILVLTFPLWIGLAGGLIGLVAGLFGLVIGLIAGVFGMLAGLIGGMFGFVGWVFDGLFDFDMHPFNFVVSPFLILLFIVAVIMVYRSKQQTVKK